MTKSILCNDKECFKCGCTRGLHRHHIYHGIANRKISEREGCWVWLCVEHHLGKSGVHSNIKYDLWLKTLCQKEWENLHGNDRQGFIGLFGKNYLDDTD